MDLVHYRLEGSTAVLHMDDAKANALSQQMLAELRDALARAEEEATAVVLAGRAERFCAGFDLRVMMSSPDAAKALVRLATVELGAATLQSCIYSPEAAARVGFLDEVLPAARRFATSSRRSTTTCDRLADDLRRADLAGPLLLLLLRGRGRRRRRRWRAGRWRRRVGHPVAGRRRGGGLGDERRV